MNRCLYCGSSLDAAPPAAATPEIEVGLLLARERYGDQGRICNQCLANRGRLAMMYDARFRR